jgi:hypothetical protein
MREDFAVSGVLITTSKAKGCKTRPISRED